MQLRKTMQLRKVYPRNDPRGIRPSNCSGTLGGAGARPLPARRSLDALRPPTATTSSRAQTSRTGTVLRHSHGRPVGRIVPPDACGSLAGGSRNASTACPRWRPLPRRSARGDWVHDRRLRAKGWGFGVQRKRQKSTPVMVSSRAVAPTSTPRAKRIQLWCGAISRVSILRVERQLVTTGRPLEGPPKACQNASSAGRRTANYGGGCRPNTVSSARMSVSGASFAFQAPAVVKSRQSVNRWPRPNESARA